MSSRANRRATRRRKRSPTCGSWMRCAAPPRRAPPPTLGDGKPGQGTLVYRDDSFTERRMARTELAHQKCVACRGGEPPMSDAEIAQMKAHVPDWQGGGGEGIKRLERRFHVAHLQEVLD